MSTSPHAASCTPENRRQGWFPAECDWCHAVVTWDSHRVRTPHGTPACQCEACTWVEAAT